MIFLWLHHKSKYCYYHPTACTTRPIDDSLVKRNGRHAGCTPFVNVNGVIVLTRAMSFAFVSELNCGWFTNSDTLISFVYCESRPVLVSCSPTRTPISEILRPILQCAADNECVVETDNENLNLKGSDEKIFVGFVRWWCLFENFKLI
jgi:hypothetical protein